MLTLNHDLLFKNTRKYTFTSSKFIIYLPFIKSGVLNLYSVCTVTLHFSITSFSLHIHIGMLKTTYTLLVISHARLKWIIYMSFL